jgi:hypothetical protein
MTQTNYNARFPAILSIRSVSQFIRLALVTIEVFSLLDSSLPRAVRKKFMTQSKDLEQSFREEKRGGKGDKRRPPEVH